MTMEYFYLVLVLSYTVSVITAAVYTDSWAVHIEGGEDKAKGIAQKHGFVYLDTIMPDYYHFKHNHVSKRSADPSPHHQQSLAEDTEVRWLEQQVSRKRVKRDVHVSYSDPKWTRMWYLNRGGGLDMNVEMAWLKGYTGEGVVVSILDDGIEKDHPDLKDNYDDNASYDVNNRDPDPTPRYDYSNENRHGTRCAGEVAAAADNQICSVGVAFRASIGGVRMLDGEVTDAVEARSLSLNPQHIDIYSASWGPDDDGRTVDGPAPLARRAFSDGITKGRGGLGSVYVWASGNGGRDGDSCNCDGYTNSIYTLSISSATENGRIPWYSEACSSTLATTYSSGSGAERQIVTTDLRKGCTETHTGTSASAPLAAGICALALQANRQLTWRDMQHIVVETARPANLIASDWVVNGNGRKVSHHFGFGLMDAAAMTDLAKNWSTVPEQRSCQIHAAGVQRKIGSNQEVKVELLSDGCRGSTDEVLYLEHVQAVLTLSASRRGEVEIFLISPAGTRSTLLARRVRDSSADGFNNWAFMTTHNWGELAMGTWTLQIKNGASSSSYNHQFRTSEAELKEWSLIMYGTATHPHSGQSGQPRPYPEEGCPTGEFYLNGFCHDHCPDTYFASNHSFSGAVSFADIRLHTDASASNGTKANETSPDWWMLVCEPCDRSCFTCVGPTDWDCVSCATPYTFDANHTCARVGGGSPGGETFTGYLDFLSHHRVYAVLAVLVLCALCALVVFGGFYVTVHSGLCESWSCCSGPGGRHGARLGAAYSRVGGSGARLLDGAGPELRDQHHPLLSDRDGELDDFDGKADDDIFSEVIHYDKYSGNITRTPI